MRTNVTAETLKGSHILLVGAGSFVGMLLIEVIKSLIGGMTLANSFVSCFPDAIGRAACIMTIFTVLYMVCGRTKTN